MAEDLVLTAISNLTSLYQDEVNLFQSVNTEREKLQSNLSTIKAVLKDAEKKQLANASNALNNWMQKLRDVVYELDDILDDCKTESIRDEYEGDRSCAFLGFLHPKRVMFRHSISGKMKAVRERLDFIAQEKDQFNFLPTERQAKADPSILLPQWRQTTSFVTEDEIYGREQDKEILVRQLLEGASHEDTLYVYPIVGMGGLGKTALAQLVYHDERVAKHFELKKWVCVSDNFHLVILIKAITESHESPDRLHGMLQGKRYLIVLDDVWNDNPDKWMQLRSILACGAKGSAVLVTTRLEKVAMMMKTPSVHPYKLSFLPEDDCWQVLRRRAFGSCIVQETQHLVTIGKEIARKCKGVPLAANTLGGLLMFTAEERFWIKIRDSELWMILPEEEGSIYASLRLSYLNLSPQNRLCFSFCSIFPKDREISKMDLIHLWMANGLISEGPTTTLELEDIGEMVVNDLYWRSLIQDVKRDPNSGIILNFKMHDLVHDLAQSISCHDTYAMEGPSSTDLSPGTRHLSIAYYRNHGGRDICNLLEKFESLRSLVFLRCSDPVALAISNSLKHTRLRALDWSGLTYKVKVLPSSIGDLKHLRYLNMSYSDITELPDSIGSLWNLQTLSLRVCTSLTTIPMSIGRLKNLRHLCIAACFRLCSMPQSMGELTSLRTLTFVEVGEPEKNEFQLSGLQHLKYLRGGLIIHHMEKVRDVNDAEKANLMEKQDLDDLRFIWSEDEDDCGNDDAFKEKQIHILEALRPSSRLRDLSLKGYQGTSFPHWMMNEIASFTYIQRLYLRICKNSRLLPPLWKLPSLKELELCNMHRLRYLIDSREDSYVGAECVSFPALEHLHIESLPSLEKIVSGEEADQEFKNKTCTTFPHLSKLCIKRCPKLNSFISGPLPSLRFLDFYECNLRIMFSMLTNDTYNLQSLHSLQELSISGCTSLEPFPDQMFHRLTSLRKLSIGYCSQLKSFPESIKSLSSLEKLRISKCRKLKDISSILLQLSSLQNLILSGLDLKSFDTDAITDLPLLKCLEVEDCPNLESLPNWMTYLASLEELKLSSCPRLTTLPDSIQQLYKLQKLYIETCPELERRCEKETGQDWHKIAHIPRLTIRNRW